MGRFRMICHDLVVFAERRIQNCTFEDGLCDWETERCSLSGSSITWMRKSGYAAAGGTGPQTGFGGFGMKMSQQYMHF